MTRLLLTLIIFVSHQTYAVDGYFENSYGLYLKCVKTLDGEGENSVDPQTLYHTGMCGGYISGIHDSVKDMVLHGLIAKAPYCMPPGINRGQLVRIVVSYIKRNPESYAESASNSVLSAYYESFPCNE
ncbi:MAG: Rap1a/Tai family immunity protein [Gammaproteobacteria bacterium]|jgi:hypothetical protein